MIPSMLSAFGLPREQAWTKCTLKSLLPESALRMDRIHMICQAAFRGKFPLAQATHKVTCRIPTIRRPRPRFGCPDSRHGCGGRGWYISCGRHRVPNHRRFSRSLPLKRRRTAFGAAAASRASGALASSYAHRYCWLKIERSESPLETTQDRQPD